MVAPDSDRDDSDRQQLVASVLLKFLGIAVVVGLAIGIGTWVVVKSLGLNETDPTSIGAAPVGPISPLPTTALPVPTDLPTDTPTGIVTGTPTAPNTGDLVLSASPLFVKPMERINLTGQWPGHDAMGLLVQRFEDGAWKNFGVQTTLRVGTFETYVQTGHLGEQIFRVFDPESQTASNEVRVTVE